MFKKNENLRENNNNMTQEMIDILKNISDLCYKASNEVYEDDDIKKKELQRY